MPLDPAKIKSRRETIGLTQGQAAAAAGMARENWIRLESGQRTDPALSTAERVAAALRCPLLKLITGT